MTMPFLTRIFRRLRGLDTCPKCGGPTFRLQCPTCPQVMSPEQVKDWIDLCADNEILRTENRMLSNRLMIHEIKAAKRDGPR